MTDPDDTRAGGSPGRAALAALDVLVVEDDADTREMLAALLERDGLRVRCAASVGEALAAVREAQPDVIVSDLALGAEHGHELAARLRDDPDTHDLALDVALDRAGADARERITERVDHARLEGAMPEHDPGDRAAVDQAASQRLDGARDGAGMAPLARIGGLGHQRLTVHSAPIRVASDLPAEPWL